MTASIRLTAPSHRAQPQQCAAHQQLAQHAQVITDLIRTLHTLSERVDELGARIDDLSRCGILPGDAAPARALRHRTTSLPTSRV